MGATAAAILSLILTFENTVAINVALGKKSKFCDNKHLSNKLTDGDTNSARAEIITSKCNKNAFVDIDLIRNYYVHYVVVYQGFGAYQWELDTGQLDYFSVKEFISGVLKNCSEYPGPSAGKGVAMVVNCQPQPPSNKVRIESKKDEGLFLSEVEVHTLGLDDGNGLTHRGCFKNFTGDRYVGFDLIQCQKICSAFSRYLAMKNEKECFCGNSYSKFEEIHPNKCDLRCGSSLKRCGGGDTYSLYIANIRLPYYTGCFQGLPINLALFMDNGITSIESCLEFCEDYYFAVLWFGHTCGCVNDKPWKEMNANHSACDSKCMEDATKRCGGINAASVYKTCYNKTSMSLKCSELFRCSGEWDENGICKSICKQGFTGPHCLERDFFESFYVSALKCEYAENSTECTCPSGYVLEGNETCTASGFSMEMLKENAVLVGVGVVLLIVVIGAGAMVAMKRGGGSSGSSSS